VADGKGTIVVDDRGGRTVIEEPMVVGMRLTRSDNGSGVGLR